jgi:hypothetical protein
MEPHHFPTQLYNCNTFEDSLFTIAVPYEQIGNTRYAQAKLDKLSGVQAQEFDASFISYGRSRKRKFILSRELSSIVQAILPIFKIGAFINKSHQIPSISS